MEYVHDHIRLRVDVNGVRNFRVCCYYEGRQTGMTSRLIATVVASLSSCKLAGLY
jgi:hypothetical protein